MITECIQTPELQDELVWDAVVIGAGPAGSLAAIQLARAGRQVLLVERKRFPRDKVCGGCLNSQAIRVLADLGLEHIALESSGATINRLSIRSDGNHLEVPIPPGMAICRSALDAGLANHAVDCGAELVMGATASILPKSSDSSEASRWHNLQLDLVGEPSRQVRARLVILAGGLQSAHQVAPHLLSSRIAPNARIGIGTTILESSAAFLPGRIHMNVAPEGYVGAVGLADGRLVLAAALDRDFISQAGGPASAIQVILERSGFESVWKEVPVFHGTPQLTRMLTSPAAERLLVIGDAASYVEPFTGEGMASALTTALAVIPHALRGIEHWEPDIASDWVGEYRKLVRQRQAWCRAFSTVSRSPFLTRAAMTISKVWPELPNWIAQRVIAASGSRAEAGIEVTDSSAIVH